MNRRHLLVALLVVAVVFAGGVIGTTNLISLDGDDAPVLAEFQNGTDPLSADTDGDGLTDSAEIDGPSDPVQQDTDGDGLDDGDESTAGTDPTVADTDEDGLSDAKEVNGPTDPTVADTDGDGLSDAKEVNGPTDPTVADTDGDGLPDGVEVSGSTAPTAADTDGDSLADGTEKTLGTDPKNPDTDSDGLSDGTEVDLGTDPTKRDTDGDSLDDGAEVGGETNPLDTDTDGDTVPDDRDRHPTISDRVHETLLDDLEAHDVSMAERFDQLIVRDGNYSLTERRFEQALLSFPRDERSALVDETTASVREVRPTHVRYLNITQSTPSEYREPLIEGGLTDRDEDGLLAGAERLLGSDPQEFDSLLGTVWQNCTSDGTLNETEIEFLQNLHTVETAPALTKQARQAGLLERALSGDGITDADVTLLANEEDDLLLDWYENRLGTSTTSNDTDNDGYTDYIEVADRYSATDFADGQLHPTEPDAVVRVIRERGLSHSERELDSVETFFESGFDDHGVDFHLSFIDGQSIPKGNYTFERFENISKYEFGKGHRVLVLTDDHFPEYWGYSDGFHNWAFFDRPYPEETIAHELGHSFGLSSGDYKWIDSRNYTADEYPSIMNYNDETDGYLQLLDKEWEHIIQDGWRAADPGSFPEPAYYQGVRLNLTAMENVSADSTRERSSRLVLRTDSVDAMNVDETTTISGSSNGKPTPQANQTGRHIPLILEKTRACSNGN